MFDGNSCVFYFLMPSSAPDLLLTDDFSLNSIWFVLYTHSERMTLPYNIDVWNICSNSILLDYSIMDGESEDSHRLPMNMALVSTHLTIISLHGVIPRVLFRFNRDPMQTYLENFQKSIHIRIDKHLKNNFSIPN
jgi:hypothetical protein